MTETNCQILLPVRDYNLDATLTSGQAFRWQKRDDGWEGVIGNRWVHLSTSAPGITATTSRPCTDWSWLTHYLQADVVLDDILKTFPEDEPLGASVAACRGLRLLRQDPWECLASFICSSTKQIVQIQQIIALLCQRHGEHLTAATNTPAYSFPTAAQIASLSEAELRACKMGFRAPYLRAAAQAIQGGGTDLDQLRTLPYELAQTSLVSLPGVGTKIANCVLLFAYGFAGAFPVDVWIMKALRELYFPKRRPTPARLQKFVASYFGPHAGYAQQYLFHFMRTRGKVSLVETRAKVTPE